MGILNHKEEKQNNLKKEYESYNRLETFGYIVGAVLIIGFIYLVYWSVFVWKG